MITKSKDSFLKLKKIIFNEKRAAREHALLSENLEKTKSEEERKMISSQIKSLKSSLKKTNNDTLKVLNEIKMVKPLLTNRERVVKQKKPDKLSLRKKFVLTKPEVRKMKFTELEKKALKRFGKKEKKVKSKKLKKPSRYIKTANMLFSDYATKIVDNPVFRALKRDLIKANMQFVPRSYISVILFSTLLSIIAAILLFVFFLFFDLGAQLPIITKATGDIGTRFLKVFWLLFLIPLGTLLAMYFYPSLEKKSCEEKINNELPFATINMSAISSSMLEPSRIFEIIISTKEYPTLEKEFTKLMNEINIYGHNLVSSLRRVAFNSPSMKLAELFNGIAITINLGGDLSEFFEKRAQSLLFEYRLEREKYTKAAETFMDIYISVVIAAPMILMLLLIMMKISGLGISLSTSMITLIMVLGVSMINILFITFLHLKQPSK